MQQDRFYLKGEQTAMENPKETTHAKPETQPNIETPKTPTQAVEDKGKPSSTPTVVPNTYDKEHKEPEKKSA
jgi:hypothetical protein